MIKTYGLTHMAIAVRDPARAYAFYRAVLGMEAVYTESDFIQAQTPGARDVLVFERAPARAGRKGGVAHFGFRLTRPEDISKALQAVKSAGGRILSRGEFCPGEPYLFCEDPDGYQVEIWYELPTPMDPKTASKRGRAPSRRTKRDSRRSKMRR
jgi:catechol 2,3-dioxygenase-like lactoylglutathione lyase family enzyme